VVDSAAGARLPSVVQLGEAFRRRRAAGGPAEQTFAALVGLELRPRRLREAGALWAAVTEQRGIQGRDALWGHPDLLPTDDDFANPQAFAQPGDDWDISELDKLGEAPKEGEAPKDKGDEPSSDSE
jgi:putative hydrolase